MIPSGFFELEKMTPGEPRSNQGRVQPAIGLRLAQFVDEKILL